MSADIVMDATVFKNPGDITERICTGEHLSVLLDLYEDTETWDTFFTSVKNLLLPEWNGRRTGEKDGPIAIAIFCSWGKHRSRALARMLDYILNRLDGFVVDEPIHLCSKGCGDWECPHGCMYPGGRGSYKKDILFDALFKRYEGLELAIDSM